MQNIQNSLSKNSLICINLFILRHAFEEEKMFVKNQTVLTFYYRLFTTWRFHPFYFLMGRDSKRYLEFHTINSSNSYVEIFHQQFKPENETSWTGKNWAPSQLNFKENYQLIFSWIETSFLTFMVPPHFETRRLLVVVI